MISKLSFFLLVVVATIFIYGGYLEYAHGESDYTWNSKGEKIYFFIGDEFVEDQCKPDEQACHMKYYVMNQIIHAVYLPDDPWREIYPGCNIWTHEILHAWGYNEEMIRDFFDCRGSKYKSLPEYL